MAPKPVQPGAQNDHLKVFSLIYRYNFAFKCTEPVAGPVQASCPSFPPPRQRCRGLASQRRSMWECTFTPVQAGSRHVRNRREGDAFPLRAFVQRVVL